MIPIAFALAFGSALGTHFSNASEVASRATPMFGFAVSAMQIALIFALLVACKTTFESRAIFSNRARVLAKVLNAISEKRFVLAATLWIALLVATAFAAAQRQLPPSRDVSLLVRASPPNAKAPPRVTLIGEIAAPPRQNEFTIEFPLRCQAARFRGRDENVSGQVWVVLPRPDAPREYSPGEFGNEISARQSFAAHDTDAGGDAAKQNREYPRAPLVPSEEFAAGDLVRFRAELFDIPRAFNSGEATRESFYIAQNCWCVARAKSFRAAKKLRDSQGVARVLNQTRRSIAALYQNRLASTRAEETIFSTAKDSYDLESDDSESEVASTRESENVAPARPYQRATSVLLTSLIFGEGGLREALPRKTRERYRAAGLSHLLVASGTQITLLAGAAIFLARLLALRGAAMVFAAAIPLGFYSALAGGEAAIARAAIAGFCVVAALVIGRAIDALSLWALALGTLLLHDPAQIGNIGLQLSFAAAWGLLALAPALRTLATHRAPLLLPSTRGAQIPSEKSWLPQSVAWLLAVQMTTLPIQLSHFGTFSALALTANALALPLAAFVTFFGVLALGFSAAAAPAYFFTRALDSLCSLVASAPNALLSASVSRGTTLILVALPLAICLAAAVALALQNAGGAWRDLKTIARIEALRFARNLRRRMRFSPRRVAKFFAAVALLCALVIFLNVRRDPLRVAFLDVGQGDGIVISTPGGKTILIDGGSSDLRRGDIARGVIVPYLQSIGARQIDALIMTHADADHCNALADVMREVLTKLVIDGAAGTGASGDASGEYSRLKRLWRAQKVEVHSARSGQTIDCGDGVRVRILAPRAGMNALSENNRSAVVRLEYGAVSVLFTGDLETEGEEVLLRSEENLRATILKVGHHGSRGASSKAFLKRVAPRVAVVSCGRFNRYGHPSQDALSRLESVGAEVFRTDRDGEVSLSCDEANCDVTTFR